MSRSCSVASAVGGAVLVLAFAAGGACHRTNDEAEVEGAHLRVGARSFDLPPGAPSGEGVEVARDARGDRFALTRGGEGRVVYLVGEHLYAGAPAKPPIDLAKAPDLTHALGDLLVNADGRSEALLADVRAKLGGEGVARLITDAVAPSRGSVDALSRRARELSNPVTEPRALAVLVRAVAARDRSRGAALGCEVLGHVPAEVPADPRDRDALVEASLVAVAQEALAGGKPACAALDKWLGDACLPSFRCGPKGPLTGREASKQDEPLCDRAALSAAVKGELARAPKDVLDVGSESRPGLFAYASLLAEGKVPEAFTKAHARRRYAVAQPKSPACEAVEPGKPCHCDEATMRDWACRHPGEHTVAVGLCRFTVDDEAHRITGVVATPPP